MADESFSKVVEQWIAQHTWPRLESPSAPPRQLNSIVVVVDSSQDGTTYRLQSGFSIFEVMPFLLVEGTYHEDTNSLTDVLIKLLAPGMPDATVMAKVDSYLLSDKPGKRVPFLLELDDPKVPVVVSGWMSFMYKVDKIYVTFQAEVPFVQATLDDEAIIGPIVATEAAGFTTAELKAARTLTPSEVKEVEEKALLSSQLGGVAIRALSDEDVRQQKLLLKFLQQFVSGDVVILSPSRSQTLWAGSIFFVYGALEVSSVIDPETLEISAALFIREPIIGLVRLALIGGSLHGAGTLVNINNHIASGNVKFTASKNPSGKYDLYVDASLDIRFNGEVIVHGFRLLTLP